jgi:hypothetical protein
MKIRKSGEKSDENFTRTAAVEHCKNEKGPAQWGLHLVLSYQQRNLLKIDLFETSSFSAKRSPEMGIKRKYGP